MFYRILVLFIVYRAHHCVAQTPPQSIAYGSPKEGSLEQAWRLPRKGINFTYVSRFSYYLFCNSYTHSKVYKTVLDTYDKLYQLHPERRYVLMECSNKKGGKMRFHRTHQNGLSIDFMSPLLKNGKPKYYKGLGMGRYLINFDKLGRKKSNRNVHIDFETLAEHLYYLEKTARNNGLRIKKVIFKLELKDQLLATKHGKELQKLNIYFAQKLPKVVDMMHDDHYHVDFEEIQSSKVSCTTYF